MKNSTNSTGKAGSPNVSIGEPKVSAFKKQSKQMAQGFVDNLNRNVKADSQQLQKLEELRKENPHLTDEDLTLMTGGLV